MCHSGDRAGDLGALQSENVLWLPDHTGMVFSLTVGKTVKRSPRSFVLKFSDDKELCPITELQKYFTMATTCQVDLSTGYVFRPLDPAKKQILNKPFTSLALYPRLKAYMERLHIWEGESPHGARSGCTITLLLLGCSKASVQEHVGWKSPTMMAEYSKLADLVSQEKTAQKVATTQLPNFDSSDIPGAVESLRGRINYKSFDRVFKGSHSQQ